MSLPVASEPDRSTEFARSAEACELLWEFAWQVTEDASDGACVNNANGPVICTRCRAQGCRGDKYGVGTQGCAKFYHGVLCGLCEKGHYLGTSAACVECPGAEQYYIIFSAGAGIIIVVGLIAFRYMELIKLLADPPSIKIFAAYLIITSSISSSYEVDLPSDYESYQSNTGFVKFDVTGVFYW